MLSALSFATRRYRKRQSRSTYVGATLARDETKTGATAIVLFGISRLVHLKETHQLDLDQSYPCPSCKQGALIPITLTEAWGCDRCKQIFELKSEPNTIGKLTTPYPRQRTWKWDGKHWILNKKELRSSLTDVSAWNKLGVILVLLWLGWTLLALTGFALALRALILLGLVVMFWVVLRR